MPIKLLALDLEATLVDNAATANARPGLFAFLTFCVECFNRVALLTTVDDETARDVLGRLEDCGDAPGAFVSCVEYVDWNGEYKDLRFVAGASPDEILFVDEHRGCVHPDQLGQWIAIDTWHGGADRDLVRVRSVFAQRFDVGM